MVHNFIDSDENEEYHRKRGYTEGICTRRPRRKLGLARALLVRSMQMFKEMGMTETALGVEFRKSLRCLPPLRRCWLSQGQTTNHLSKADRVKYGRSRCPIVVSIRKEPVMQLRCSYCQTMFAISHEETLAAIEHVADNNLKYDTDAHCPNCRRALPCRAGQTGSLLPGLAGSHQDHGLGSR